MDIAGDGLICNECMKPFCSRAKLNRHIKEKHSLIHMRFECHKCKRNFARQEHLKRHERASHKGDKFQCPLCVARFVEKCQLRRHLLDTHEVFKCGICQAIMKTRSLEDHVCDSQSVVRDERFGCRFCPKKYKRKAYLVKHLEDVHVKETSNFQEVVDELGKLETPHVSVGKSCYSDSRTSGKDFYEFEIGLEYDIQKEAGAPKEEKKSVFTGMIKLPKFLSHTVLKNPIFERVELSSRGAKEQAKELDQATAVREANWYGQARFY